MESAPDFDPPARPRFSWDINVPLISFCFMILAGVANIWRSEGIYENDTSWRLKTIEQREDALQLRQDRQDANIEKLVDSDRKSSEALNRLSQAIDYLSGHTADHDHHDHETP